MWVYRPGHPVVQALVLLTDKRLGLFISARVPNWMVQCLLSRHIFRGRESPQGGARLVFDRFAK